MKSLQTADYLVFLFYFVIVASYGYWVYHKKKKATITASHDYFLAEGSLTWWAIGASLIASNISAEHLTNKNKVYFFKVVFVVGNVFISKLCNAAIKRSTKPPV